MDRRTSIQEQLQAQGEADDLDSLAPGQRLILQLYRTGMSRAEIARRLDVSAAHVGQTLKKLGDRGYSLTEKDMVRKAISAVDAHIQGITHGEVTPTAASQIQAAAMVLDRSDPKITVAVTSNISVNQALEAAKQREQAIVDADYTDITPLTEPEEDYDEE